MKMNCSCDNVLQNCLRYLETRLPFKSNICRYTFFLRYTYNAIICHLVLKTLKTLNSQ